MKTVKSITLSALVLVFMCAFNIKLQAKESLSNKEVMKLLRDVSEFKKGWKKEGSFGMGWKESVSHKLGLCQKKSGKKLSKALQCMQSNGYVTIGKHLGFDTYPIYLTQKGKEIIKVATKNCGFAGTLGKYYEVLSVTLDIKIEGKKVNDNGTAIVRFSTLVEVPPEVQSCLKPNTFKPVKYKAKLSKYDTGWVIDKIYQL